MQKEQEQNYKRETTIRNIDRKSVVDLTKELTLSNCKVMLKAIERIEPKTLFPEYILIILKSPIWNIERILKKYDNINYYCRKSHRLHLENKLMELKRIEKGT